MTSHQPLAAFAAYSGSHRPKMLLVGEAWGEGEATARKPFVGTSGQELFRMLGEAMPDAEPELHAKASEDMKYGLAWVRARDLWLEAIGIGATNVLNLRPPGNKLEALCSSKKEVGNDYHFGPISRALYLRPEYLGELDRLSFEISDTKPNLIVALGNTACWAILHATNIGSIRGAVTTIDSGVKVLPTYHPAGVLRQWAWRPIVVADLMKASREAEFPEMWRPSRHLIINPTIEEWESWCHQTMAKPPPYLACDTETSLGLIDTISFARSGGDGICCQIGPHRKKIGERFETIWPVRYDVPVVSYWTEEEEFRFWIAARQLLETPGITKLFQNALYDIQYLGRMGLRPKACTEDTMLLHHSIFPEMQKGLGFLGSIYSNEASWKLMRRQRADSEKRDE